MPGAAPAARASRRSSTGSRAGAAATGPRPRASARRAAGRRPPRSRPRRASSRPSRSARRKPMPAAARLWSRLDVPVQIRPPSPRCDLRGRRDRRPRPRRPGGGGATRRGLLALGDFAANMAGALLLGFFVAAMRGHRAESPGFALLTTGVCGTLTTFATLQLELFEMVDARPSRPRRRLRRGDAGRRLRAGQRRPRGRLLLDRWRAKGATGRHPVSAAAWIAVGLLGA